MAEVFKATVASNRDLTLAIKRILPHFSQDQKLISMLVNEARLSVGLSHPNIVPVLDFGVVDGKYFIAMEYIYGKDLKSILIRSKLREIELPTPMALHIMRDVLRGLDFAHHKCDNYGQPLQIVHRDISPQNIMVSFGGQVKILDFGIAKATSSRHSTQEGTLKGKFSYMSPEQASAKKIDPRTDIYSAGIVLWEMLTLESCIQGDSDIQLLKNVRDARVRNPHSIRPSIPSDLAEIVMKALGKKPKKRYQSAGEFADVLETYLNDRHGPLSPADVSGFLRKLFEISPSELKIAPPRPEALDRHLEEDLSGAYKETVRARDEDLPTPKSSPHRAPWAAEESFSLWKPLIIGIVIVTFIWLLGTVSPRKVFEAFDRQAIRIAKIVHRIRSPKPPAEKSLISIADPASSQPLYSLQYSPPARKKMNKIPFEPFEMIRDQIKDLALNPRPHLSSPIPKRPGTRYLRQSGYRVTYQINEYPRTITIEDVVKAGR